MPGLPRKSTKNQFSKLMKKSGKSKSNTMYGATDTSKKKISTKEELVIKFDDFKIFESEINLETYYEIRLFNKLKEEKPFGIDDDFNPYDIEEVVPIFLLYQKKYPEKDIFIKKITETIVDNKTINEIELKLDADKYNL